MHCTLRRFHTSRWLARRCRTDLDQLPRLDGGFLFAIDRTPTTNDNLIARLEVTVDGLVIGTIDVDWIY